jgi:hypothetical protein
MKKCFTTIAISALILLIAAIPFVTVAAPARALPGGSSNVALIGGNVFNYTGGGWLNTSGFAGGDTFTFTSITPASVSAATLALYDTVVLNMACTAMQCNSGILSPAQQDDLENFVFNGGKLIIYDSECWFTVDYSWLIYPFTTANPGAMGAQGTLNIVEENVLSTAAAGPYYINAAYLGSSTDAVGDMNVMTTLDSHWCLDMSGTNYLQVTGPVHTYARYGAGLIIYNGLDMDYLQYYDDAELKKIWEQELRVAFNPTPVSDLPCGIVVTGISLTPVIATNPLNVNHTVTARVTDLLGNGVPDIPVTFEIISGPNAGMTSGAPINTDSGGYASWFWSSSSEGTDVVEATATLPDQSTITSQTVDKIWEKGEIVEVGGDIYPANKAALLAPWIALAVAALAGTAVLVRRRSTQN